MKTKLLFALITVAVFGETLIADIVEEANSAKKQGNYTKAFNLFEKACEKGNMRGCYFLGVMYEYGQGVKRDDFRTIRLFQKACNGGYADGCGSLGNMYDRGEGTNQDELKAAKLYSKEVVLHKKACDKGDAESCWSLGVSYKVK